MQQQKLLIGIIATALVVAFVSGIALISRTDSQTTGDPIEAGGREERSSAPQLQGGTTMQPEITDLTTGTGAEAAAGKTITVHYRGTLLDGTQFDSSYDRGQPFTFNLGAGQVIQGWETGFAGMKVGGKRKLVIPPELGYGPQAAGSIPPNSTLTFEVELLDVK